MALCTMNFLIIPASSNTKVKGSKKRKMMMKKMKEFLANKETMQVLMML